MDGGPTLLLPPGEGTGLGGCGANRLRVGALADRLKKNIRHLRKWGRRQGFSCLRLYDHDVPEFALSLDDYEGHVLTTVSEAGAARWSDEQLADEIGQALECRELVFKHRGRRAGGTRLTGDEIDPEQALLVDEDGLKFEVNLHGYGDTGLFLDHRLTRRMVRQAARGLRVLNLFCYTGSFSVAAAVGGARQVVSVDMSRTYLNWAARNLTLNHQDALRHPLVAADVLQWIPEALQSGERFDLVICDPPTFSCSKRMRETFQVQEAQSRLLPDLMAMLQPGGKLLFSCNDSRFRLAADLPLKEITAQTRSEDFRRGSGHRCWSFQAP